jgi:integrase
VEFLAKLHDPKYPEKTWIPLIVMYSGMRSGEVAQLYLDDLVCTQKHQYFRLAINKDLNQHVKKGVGRDVPIHAQLIELGLLDYADFQRKRGEVQLFPNCRSTQGGYYSNSLCTALNEIVDMVSDDRKLRVYSLRAQFRNSVEEVIVTSAVDALKGRRYDATGFEKFYTLALDDIMGHKIKGSEGDRTYRKVQLEIMSLVLNLAKYDIDFSGLKSALKRALL